MNIYIDESGSISSRMSRLKELDKADKMFQDGNFKELKGSQFDSAMKKDFVQYFAKNNYFEVYYIKIENSKLTETFCKSTARAFNYVLCKALQYLYTHGYLEDEGCNLQLDERNEKTDAKHFLRQYLNTELLGANIVHNEFQVQYYDSSNNKFIQMADVFANLLFSHLQTGAYVDEIDFLIKENYIKCVFKFPP